MDWSALRPAGCVLIVTSFMSVASWAEGESESPVETIEEIETIEEVELVEPVFAPLDDPGAPLKRYDLKTVFGRLHPAAVHFPLAWGLLLLLFELYLLRWGGEEPRRLGLYLGLLTVLSCAPAAFSGYLRSLELTVLVPASRLLVSHRNWQIAFISLLVAAVVWRLLAVRNGQGIRRVVYVGLLVVALITGMNGAHHGGELVYGEHFLPF